MLWDLRACLGCLLLSCRVMWGRSVRLLECVKGLNVNDGIEMMYCMSLGKESCYCTYLRGNGFFLRDVLDNDP
jgi:hypothetical protein